MAANTITRGRLRRLAEVRPDRGRVLSVYLNLDPSEMATPPARASAITSVVNDASRRIEACEDLDHEERLALQADVERVREALSGDVAQGGTQGVAVFACQPAGLLEVVTLRRPLETRVVLERTPFVEPLALAGTGERWCALLVNRRTARLFVGDGEDLEETDHIQDDVHRRHEQGGWSQSNYQRSVDKDVDDHVRRAADAAFELYQRRGFDRLLVGAPEELVTDLEGRLHAYLRERIAGRVACDVEHSTLEEVRECVAPHILEHGRKHEREALDRVKAGIGAGGRAAAGLAGVLDAINQAKVETLLLEASCSASGRIDPTTAMLYPEDGAPAGVATEPCDDVVERAIERALEQSAEVIGVRHHDDLGPLGGIAAVLRY
jgi:peptide subunit release factor 1 (eRF1)